jgi:hypothetical protein
LRRVIPIVTAKNGDCHPRAGAWKKIEVSLETLLSWPDLIGPSIAKGKNFSVLVDGRVTRPYALT